MEKFEEEKWTKIEIRPEELEGLLGRTPKWLIRWGMIIISLFVCVLVVGSIFFKYPETLTSIITIVSENPQVSIIAHANGKIDYLYIKNQSNIKSGEVLAILENTADFKDVLALKNSLIQLSSMFVEGSPISSAEFSDQYILGTIQSSYANFQKQYKEFQNFLIINLAEKKIRSVNQQINDYQNYLLRLQIQADNLAKIVQLDNKQYARDSGLYANKVIPPMEFDKSERSIIQSKNNYQNILATISNINLQINQLGYQIIELQNQTIDQRHRLLISLKEAYDNLMAVIAEWEKTYLLISPIDGKVAFTKYWNINQYVMFGDIVFSIIPFNPQQISGRVKLPISGSGKVTVGQSVHILLDNFPYQEYGIIEGKVESISLVPESNAKGVFYTAEITLPNGLMTNYKRKLPLNQEMQGIAKIVTKDLSLFERFINPIRGVINNPD